MCDGGLQITVITTNLIVYNKHKVPLKSSSFEWRFSFSDLLCEKFCVFFLFTYGQWIRFVQYNKIVVNINDFNRVIYNRRLMPVMCLYFKYVHIFFRKWLVFKENFCSFLRSHLIFFRFQQTRQIEFLCVREIICKIYTPSNRGLSQKKKKEGEKKN